MEASRVLRAGMNPHVLSAFSTISSKTLQEANAKSAALYRQTLKSIPQIISMYALDVTPAELKPIIDNEFRKYSQVKDPQVLDVLVYKGKQELEETLLMFKTKSHVFRYINPDMKKQPEKHSTFLERFFAGTA
mmetsp:Transcript_6177/g.10658  ORF Transcript_6177/g.10658 Transcript_6177/m.10658 type:complete len:133 (-) Transcript_6177:264-662(-)|eukprot:CAMPEP_0196659792 /NCGR_PEP_ID=MMETSP1086-20130531/36614_1 /TAXON_ID=77921 /ORGANISM="Cyanoptyche  gloeocystis , Strain SAG4.97" /LENGTH=132 /DNA_ID=CAMNT_0041993909 /DNA_START=69 /DNA_END=467 /DNA_ORIENTATION=-